MEKDQIDDGVADYLSGGLAFVAGDEEVDWRGMRKI